MSAVSLEADRIERASDCPRSNGPDPALTGHASAVLRKSGEGTRTGDPTLWDLVTEERVPIEDLNGAVDAYLADPATGAYRIGAGYSLDLAASIARYATQREVADLHDQHLPSRRSAVRTALLMARPVRP